MELRKLTEEDLNTIRQYNENIYELYLTVENGCQSDITLDDITECMECICCLLKDNMEQHKLYKRLCKLKDIVCDQSIKIYELENAGE